MDNYVGEKLGNYRLTRLLGVGGYAAVYLAAHIYLKTQAAIKILRVSLDEEALARFLTEARTIAHLDHPNIVRTLEFGVQGNTAYLVMNYAPNGTILRRYPRGSIVPLYVVIRYVRQIADALQYAHARGVVHRDVKPENILLGRDGEILLSDFGLAVMSASSPSRRPVDKAGTIGYMAPEQIEGRPDRGSDQYGLGVVVYEWLCGSLPFTGLDKEVMVQHLRVLPPSLCERAPSVPLAIEQVVMKALSKDPSQRFLSVLQFAQALEEAYQPYKLVQLLPSGTKVDNADTGDKSLKQDARNIAETELAIDPQPTPVLDGNQDDKMASSAQNIPARQTASEPVVPILRRISERLIVAGFAGLIAASIVSATVFWSLRNPGFPAFSSHGSSHIVQPSRTAQATSGMMKSSVSGARTFPTIPTHPSPTPTQNVGSTASTMSASTAISTPRAASTANRASSSAYTYTISTTSTPVPPAMPTPTLVPTPTPTLAPIPTPTPQLQPTPPGKGRQSAPGQLKKNQG